MSEETAIGRVVSDNPGSASAQAAALRGLLAEMTREFQLNREALRGAIELAERQAEHETKGEAPPA